MRATRAIVIVISLLLAGLVASGEAEAQSRRRTKPRTPPQQKEKEPAARTKEPAAVRPAPKNAPLSVFRGLEAAWRAGNASALSRHVGSKRVYLRLADPGGTDGFYSQSQVYYLFKEIFKSYRQVAFEFVKFRNLDKPGRSVYGIATRSWKDTRSGRIFTDKVYVTLRLEGSRWVVAEIKTAS